jgi:hypothetical protein
MIGVTHHLNQYTNLTFRGQNSKLLAVHVVADPQQRSLGASAPPVSS